jgi:pyrroloquinoline quinone (PQQ) biosynthesis protein C
MEDFFSRLQRETASGRERLYSSPVIGDAIQGRISRETYLAYLTEAYHHVKNTLPLLLLMCGRIPKEKEWLRRSLIEYIGEETGHDEWILSDIKNAGGDPDVVRKSEPSIAVELMNAYNYDWVCRKNPMGYFGMIFVLEGASTALATKAAASIAKSLQMDDSCFSYLNSHGDLDIEHVKFIGSLLNKIDDPVDQEDIIHASKVITHLYTDMIRSLPNEQERRAA